MHRKTREVETLREQDITRQQMGKREDLKQMLERLHQAAPQELEARAKKIKLPSWHPIQICMDEHKIIKKNLKKLGRTVEKLNQFDSFKQAKRQMNTLKELAHFFLETEKHHKREEDALFPRLEAHGITEPPQIFKVDHVEFLAKKKALYDLVMNAESKNFEEFVDLVAPCVEFLVENLESHIYKEDNILYPLSLQVLEKYEWKEVRKKFDAIGYCCFAPADIQKKKKKHKMKTTRTSKRVSEKS